MTELARLVYPSAKRSSQPSYTTVCNDGQAFNESSSSLVIITLGNISLGLSFLPGPSTATQKTKGSAGDSRLVSRYCCSYKEDATELPRASLLPNWEVYCKNPNDRHQSYHRAEGGNHHSFCKQQCQIMAYQQ